MKRVIPAAVLLLAASVACADGTLEYSGGSADCHADFTRVAVQGLSMRIDNAPPAQDMSMVYDSAEKVGVALDHQRKQFFELEFDDDAIDFQGDVMKSSSNMIDKKTRQMQQQLPPGAMPPGASGMPQMDGKVMEQMMQQNMEHLPKEQRAQMEKAMKEMRSSGYFASQSEPVIEVTGEKRDIGGLACSVERVTQDGQLVREDCRASLDAIGLDPADVKRMQRVILRMQKYANTVTANLSLVKNVRRDHVDPQHPLVERRCFDQDKPIGEVTLRVRNETLPASLFVTPSDYSRMDTGMRGH